MMLKLDKMNVCLIYEIRWYDNQIYKAVKTSKVYSVVLRLDFYIHFFCKPR